MAAEKILMLVGDFVEDYEVDGAFSGIADGRSHGARRSSR